MHSFYLHKKSMNILITNLQLFCNFFSVSWFPQNNEDTKKTRPSVEAWRQWKEITKFAEITPKCLNNNQLLVYFKYLCVLHMFSLILCYVFQHPGLWLHHTQSSLHTGCRASHSLPSTLPLWVHSCQKPLPCPTEITKVIAKPARLRKVNTLPASRLWPALSHSLLKVTISGMHLPFKYSLFSVDWIYAGVHISSKSEGFLPYKKGLCLALLIVRDVSV